MEKSESFLYRYRAKGDSGTRVGEFRSRGGWYILRQLRERNWKIVELYWYYDKPDSPRIRMFCAPPFDSDLGVNNQIKSLRNKMRKDKEGIEVPEAMERLISHPTWALHVWDNSKVPGSHNLVFNFATRLRRPAVHEIIFP